MYQLGKWTYIVAMCIGNAMLYAALGGSYNAWDMIWNWVCFQMIVVAIDDGEGIKWKTFFGMFSIFIGIQFAWGIARPALLAGKSFESALITALIGLIIIIPVYIIYSIGILFFFKGHFIKKKDEPKTERDTEGMQEVIEAWRQKGIGQHQDDTK